MEDRHPTLRVRFLSTDPSVANVDENGGIVAVSEGTSTICAITHNGLRAAAQVTVNQ